MKKLKEWWNKPKYFEYNIPVWPNTWFHISLQPDGDMKSDFTIGFFTINRRS